MTAAVTDLSRLMDVTTASYFIASGAAFGGAIQAMFLDLCLVHTFQM